VPVGPMLRAQGQLGCGFGRPVLQCRSWVCPERVVGWSLEGRVGNLRSVHAVAPGVAQGALAFGHGDGGVEGAARGAGAGLDFAADCVDGGGGRLVVVKLS